MPIDEVSVIHGYLKKKLRIVIYLSEAAQAAITKHHGWLK